ncbi:DUF3556 domain-containing protein [Leekyejoonella antrihumi]|uniref:DUF3556 domain-containing protein n=1 Tax=Leekyejoonella antrihumi TaxID=1660198 RepID=UPI001C95AB5A|nr:DUF3556 domain-containing protein [Leekyejoonella antrihumi]
MGFLTPSPQPVEPSEFVRLSFLDRVRILSTHWVDDDFGTPKMLYVVYTVKMLGLYLACGILIASLTSDISFLHVTSWWDNIVVYQKLAVWLMLLEVIGLGGAWGPLCGHFKPMTGNIRYWLRPGTIRMAPWGKKVPLTGGDTRTVGDVVLYLAVLGSLIVPLAVHAENVAGFAGQQSIPGWTFVPILIMMPLMGLRDKVVFLAGRSEQYLPIMLYTFLLSGSFVDMVIAFKVVIACVWICAGISKFGDHFIKVVPPMVSNSPAMPGKFIKRLHHKNAPEDIRPSSFSWFMAHLGGTSVDIVIPLVLLFTTNIVVAAVAAIAMLVFHLFITSTFPLAVPLEWNAFFGFAAITLWIGHNPGDFAIYTSPTRWV